MVFYRKYRPQTLDDLIGQESVKKVITAAHLGGKLSHAYLFVGPRGTGKTSTARILAKMVNCLEKNPPCNKCDICTSITDGSCLDLIEIDAASNRGIDDIRQLRDNIKLSPSSLKKKVYIIDEVHMLTTEAFNALLKTLEEPPAHTMFILATTEAQKVPQTILSRVQRLDFKLATVTDVVLALKKIADRENLKITNGALKLLAQKADGSFRDGVKLLDQISSENSEITEDKIGSILGVTNFESIIEILKSLSSKKTKSALEVLIKQLESGISPKEFLLSLMGNLRYLVLIKNDLGVSLVKEEVGSDRYQELVEVVKGFRIQDLIKSIDVFQQAYEKLKTASIPSLPLELAVVEICQENVSREETSKVEPVIPSNEGIQLKEQVSVTQIAVKSQPQEKPTDTSPAKPVQSDKNVEQSINEITISSEVVKIQEKWTFVLETVKQENYSLEALLRNAKIADCVEGKVLIEVPYAFHQRILESPKSRDLIEAILTDILGRPAQISTVIGHRPQREDLANIEVAADDEVISMAAEIFQGKIVD
jgi:DNA polymerase III subunit gamma/tau